MKILNLLLLSGLIFGCASAPKPENSSGLIVKIESAKNHTEGVDLKLAIYNSTQQPFRLPKQGSVGVYLDGSDAIRGQLSETVNIAPGGHKKVTAHFHFINSPRIYQKGIFELTPTKVFRTCKVADLDPDVMPDDEREPAGDIEPDTCNRFLKRPIRIEF